MIATISPAVLRQAIEIAARGGTEDHPYAQHAWDDGDPWSHVIRGLCASGDYGTDLYDADLRGVDLRGADLRGADLTGADLRDADLRGADLTRADLRDADLRGANLTGANLTGADLTGADLTGAKMHDHPHRPTRPDRRHRHGWRRDAQV